MRPSVIAFAIVLVSAACASPTVEPPSQAAAQGTSVRRTAVAEAQRIIANNPTPTPTPQPTPTQPPSCACALWWHEARDHLGESRVIQGPVVRARPGGGGSLWLEIGQPYPDPTGLAVLVLERPGADLAGKTICVDGRIATIEGATAIDARGAARIAVIN